MGDFYSPLYIRDDRYKDLDVQGILEGHVVPSIRKSKRGGTMPSALKKTTVESQQLQLPHVADNGHVKRSSFIIGKWIIISIRNIIITLPTDKRHFCALFYAAWCLLHHSLSWCKSWHTYLLGTCLTTWWRHQMEAFSALLGLCVGNSPVTGELPSQRPVTRSFDGFFDLRPNKRFSKQSRRW